MDTEQTQQALALYYHAGAFVQCEVLLRHLLEVQPQEPRHWHLLTSVYLQQNKKKQALDQLTLARNKQILFSERDLLLLANLQNANDNPYGAALTLEAALASGELPASGATYRTLFEFWLRAREQEKAQQALQQAARLSNDPQLFLYLAQLQMEQQDYQGMQQTMLAACAKQLPQQYVGRANLLLGISQLKLGDEVAARRSLINATLIGGANAEAGQWLDYMNAEPATDAEARRIVGVCFGPGDRQLDTAAGTVRIAPEAREAVAGIQATSEPAAFVIKTVPPMRLFYAEYDKTVEQVMALLRPAVISLNVALVKSGGSVDGPLQMIFNGNMAAPGSPVRLQLGIPFRGSASGTGKFRVQTTEPFRCASQSFVGAPEALGAALARFAAAVQGAKHVLTGEARLVPAQGGNAGSVQLELQLGIE
ncbi:MAG: hypothetical protein R3E64_05600 [Halioglobus sp.]